MTTILISGFFVGAGIASLIGMVAVAFAYRAVRKAEARYGK
jgi:hypothetical protein